MKKLKINSSHLIKSPASSSFKFILIIYLLVATSELYAAEWKQDYGVGATINYIDNIRLAGTGLEQSDTVVETRPYFSAQAESDRTNLDFYYQLQAINYSNNSDANTVYHQLFADMNVELSEEFLFLELQATNSQSIISTTGNLPVGNLPISANRTDIATYSVSPYISRNFFGRTNMLLRGTFMKTYYDDKFVRNIGSDVENRSYIFALSNTSSNVISWKLDFNRDEFSTNVFPEKNYYEIKSLTLSYDRSKQLQPYATAGEEDNSIYQSTMNSGGTFWDAGLVWNPTPRTSMSAAGGKRFYGDSKKFSWETRGRKLQIVIDYNETVTSSSTLFSRQSLSQVQGGATPNEFLDITDTVFVSKRYTSTISYKKSKTNISWGVYSEDRIFISSNELQKYQGSNLSWGWRLGSRTTVNTSAYWFKNIKASQKTNNILGFSLNAVRNVSNKVSTEIGYRYRNNEVEAPFTGYKQNIIYANITASFK